MNTNNNTPDNINLETMSKEALLIYFDKDCKMRFIGDKAALFADDLYIKVSIKQGLFMLGTTYGLDFSDDRKAYFPHILDCEFENFLLNYCISQHVPGLYLLHSGDVYIDMKFNTEAIEQIVKDHIELPDYGNEEPKEIINLTDVYFESSEYNNKDYIFKSIDYAVEKTGIDGMLQKLKENKSPVEAAQIEALENLYNDLIETVARCEFRKAFHLGVNITDRLIATPAGKCRVIIDDEDDEFELDEFDFEEGIDDEEF